MKFNKIIGVLLGVAASLGAWSCTDEVEYNPTEPTTTDEVFFSNADPAQLSIPLDATQIDVKINRLQADDELTVNLSGTSFYVNDKKEQISAENVFSIPASVTFAKGEKVSNINVGVDFSKVLSATDYSLSIKIEGESASQYGEVEKTFIVSYEPWTEWERLSETGMFQQAGLWSYQYEQYVFYRKSLINPDLEQYAVPGPFSDFEFEYVFNVDKSKTVTVNGEECYFVTMDEIETPLETSDGGGYFVLKDYYYFFCEDQEVDPVTDYELVINYLIDKGRSFSYFNPKRGLIGSYQTIVGTLLKPGYSYGSFMNFLQLGGYADYYIDFSKVYNIVDETGAESVVISAYKSDDVYSYAYTVTPGKLDEAAIAAEVEAIKANSEAELFTESQRYFTYTPAEEGDYTIVAVGFNQSNEEVYQTSYTFTFTTVKAASEWESAGKAKYTDGFLYPFFQGLGGETWMVDIERHKTNPGLIRMVNPYNSKNWPSGKAGWDLPGNYYIVINMSDPDAVYVEESPMGVMLSSKDGAITAGSLAAELMAEGYPLSAIKQVGYCGTLEDGVITFPGMALTTWFANDQGSTPSNWDMNIDPYVYNEAGEPVSYNIEAQIKGTGWFELDLNSLSAASTPRKNHPAEMKANYNAKVKSPIAGKPRKAPVKIVTDVNELVKNNFKQAKRDANL